jgi:large subunit ribosomal protein L9
MKVILNKDLPNLGEEGDVCDVNPGYARNYLLPRNLVLQYNNKNLSLLEGRRETIEQRKEEKKKQAMSVKDRLEAEPLTITMPAGENGRLFGSVTSATVAEALEKQGIDVERKQIDIPAKTIKSVGTTKIRVRLYDQHEAELLVQVEPTGGQKKSESAASSRATQESGGSTESSPSQASPDAAGEIEAEPQGESEEYPSEYDEDVDAEPEVE